MSTARSAGVAGLVLVLVCAGWGCGGEPGGDDAGTEPRATATSDTGKEPSRRALALSIRDRLGADARCGRREDSIYRCLVTRGAGAADSVEEPYDVTVSADGCWRATLVPDARTSDGGIGHFDPPPGGFKPVSSCIR